MINKIVKLEDPSILAVLYPDYEWKSEVTWLDSDKKVIYNGQVKPRLSKFLQENTKSFISVVGTPDEDYTNREKLVNWVYTRKNKVMPKYVKDQLDVLDVEELNYCIKIFNTVGVWPYSQTSEEVTIYNLYKETVGSVKDLLKVYYQLLQIYPHPVIEASFYTFLQRSLDIENQEVSPGYKKLLKSFYSKSSNKIKPALYNYAQSSQTELDFINLLLSLR